MAYMCVLSAGLLLPTTRKTHRGGAILSAEKRNARNLAEYDRVSYIYMCVCMCAWR